MTIYERLVILCWIIFIVFWGISAIGAKRTVQRQGMWIRFVAAIVLVVLFNTRTVQNYFLIHRAVSTDPLISILEVLCAIGGVGLAIWARIHLGRNWGMPMTLKENPELVTTGLYVYLRNPIYSGVLLAMFGAVLVFGIIWYVPFLFFLIYFVYSAKKEESIMLAAFPNQYPEYKARTKMLIPFIF